MAYVVERSSAQPEGLRDGERSFVTSCDAIVRNELAAAGCPLEQRGNDGLTPLHHAVANGNAAAVRKLVELGADPSALTPSGESAVAIAAAKSEEMARAVVTQSGEPATTRR